jgi:hypothetical protein
MAAMEVVVLASSSGDGGGIGFFFFVIGPAAGFAVWGWIHATYRNRAARYMPERVVAHTVDNLTGDDAFIKSLQTGASSLEGRNDNEPHVRAAVSNFLTVEALPPPSEQPPSTDQSPPEK